MGVRYKAETMLRTLLHAHYSMMNYLYYTGTGQQDEMGAHHQQILTHTANTCPSCSIFGYNMATAIE